MTKRLQNTSQIIAVLLGLAIPALILGRAVFAVILGLAIILILIDKSFADTRRDFLDQCRRPTGTLLIALFFFCLPGLFTSDFPLRSFEAVARSFVFCGIGVVIWSYLKDRPALFPVWMKSFIIASAVAIGFAFFSQYLFPEPYWFLQLKGWRSVDLSHRLKGYAALTIFIVPILVFGALKARSALSIIAIIASLCFLILVWKLSARSAVAGLLGVVLCLAIAVGIRYGNKFQVFLAAGFAALSFGGIIWWLRVTRDRMLVAAPDGDYFLPVWLIDFERQAIWTYAFEIAMKTPWFGRGANTINFAPGADQHLKGTVELHLIPAHPHNWMVELFAEIGIIALALLIAFITLWAFRMLRQYRAGGDSIFLLALSIFAGYWSSGLFNFSFWSAWWQLAFILSMALALSIGSAHKREK